MSILILNHLTDEQRQEMSLIELAYHILDEKKEVMPFKDLTTVMSEFKGMSQTEMQERLVQFYTDLNTAGTFISLGHNTWGLRDWYPLDAIDEEVQELAKPKKRRKKAAVAEVDEIEDEEEDFEEKEPELGEEPIVLSDKNADDDDIDGDLKDHLPDGIEGELTIVDDKDEI
mgnify:CR=1 FL=1